MINYVISFSRYVVIEALHTRLLVMSAILLGMGMGLVTFLGSITITETAATQSSFLAAFLRIIAVYTMSLWVITSVAREFHERSIDLWLSFPVTRGAFVVGKLLGFGIVAVMMAVFYGSILGWNAPWWQVIIWTSSLICELWIITNLSLFCVLTFQHAIPSFSIVLGFYILARSIDALQSIVHSPLNSGIGLMAQITLGAVELLATLLPHFDRFTRTEWLIYNTGTVMDLLHIIGQTAVYVTLLTAMSLFDFYRKNL